MTYDLITQALQRIASYIHKTPLVYSRSLSSISGADVYLKLENLQKTGSFKVRGAFNKMLCIDESSVVAASMGNHAQAVAFAAYGLGKDALIVMPRTAPLIKQEATKGYGAEVVLQGEGFQEALQYALEQKNRVFIHAFDDEDVIAGQGTIGIEIVNEIERPDAVLVPVGGGGLISGISLALKEAMAGVCIYGVQAEAAPAAYRSFRAKTREEHSPLPTIADGIAIGKPGEYTFALIQKYVDDIFLASEDEIAMAVLLLMERKKLVVEGAGAVAMAALLKNRGHFRGKRVVLVLSGGNIDFTLIDRIIHRGLVQSGRIAVLAVMIDDLPGSLGTMLSRIEAFRPNILNIFYNRDTKAVPIGRTKVHLFLELRNREQGMEIRKALTANGYDVDMDEKL